MARRIPPSVIAAATALLIAALSIPDASGLPPPVPPVPPPPAAAARVHVQAGKLTSGIDAAMRRTGFGAISGRVVESGTTQPLKGVQVVAYSPSLQLDRRDYTDSDGRYVLHLPASARGYAICFRATPRGLPKIHGGTSRTGWAPECFRNRVWSGARVSVPSTVRRVRVSKGQERSHVDARLQPGGAISGRVVQQGTNRPVLSSVYVHSIGAPHYQHLDGTDGSGRYRVVGLPFAARGYQVCFDTRDQQDTPGTVGRCFGTADWPVPKLPFEGNPPWSTVHWPKGATHIHVRSGSVRTGIGARVRPAGAIVGRIVDKATGARLDDPEVDVFDSHGRFVGGADAFGGRFKVTNLPPAAADYVCVLPQRYAESFLRSGHADSYQPGCYRDSRWTGRRSRTAGVSLRVVGGKSHKHVIIALRRASTIRVRVTSAADGQPVVGRVYLFASNGKLLASDSVDALDRVHVFMGLPASSSGYLVCANAIRRKHLDKPWLRPECYGHAGWDGANAAPSPKARPIRIGADEHRRGVNIALHAGGAISGSLTKADTGNPPHFGRLFVIDDLGRHVVQTETRYDGTWSVEGLDPARSYRICFANPPRSWKYQPSCYPDVRWYRPWAE